MGFFKKHGHDCNAHDFDINLFLSQDMIDEMQGLVGKRFSAEKEPMYDPFGDDFRFRDELDFDENDLAYRIKLDTTGIIDSRSPEIDEMFGDFQDDNRDWYYATRDQVELDELQHEANVEHIEAELLSDNLMMPSFSSNKIPVRRLTAYEKESKGYRKKENNRARRN